jgi:uncharacterized protein involved in exopolysaccharide biosynthesis
VEKSMMAEVKENSAFKVLDPPQVPDRAIWPKKRVMVSIAFVISLFAGVLLAFVVEWIQNARAAARRTVQ